MTERARIDVEIANAELLLRELRRRARILAQDDKSRCASTLTSYVLEYLENAGEPRKVKDIVKAYDDASYWGVASALRAQVRRGLLRRTIGVGMYEYVERKFT